MLFVGKPTSAALRVAGQLPTADNMVDSLIAAFEAAANDDSLDEATRTRAQKIWDSLLSGGSKIAIAALGSGGGHFLSGHEVITGQRPDSPDKPSVRRRRYRASARATSRFSGITR